MLLLHLGTHDVSYINIVSFQQTPYFCKEKTICLQR